jgi:2-polyprenyl-3-methyl-5-hydroxy-6-metoxy-1,4-benzoquinol methylase
VKIAYLDEFSLVEHFGTAQFDCVVMADVLEHLRDPWRVAREVVDVASAGATIIACVPNVRHIDTIINLVFRGKWPYRDRGIHDRTHLRFFTRKNLLEMFASDQLSVERIHTHYRVLERPAQINKVARYLAIPGLKGFLAFQYIIVFKKLGGPHTLPQGSIVDATSASSNSGGAEP